MDRRWGFCCFAGDCGVGRAAEIRAGAVGGIEAPGVVVHNGVLQKIVFGEFDGRGSVFTSSLLEAFSGAGVDAAVSDDIARVTWEKFVFLVGMSATTTVVRQPVGVVRANHRTRALLRDVMDEVVAVGRAFGVDFTDGFVDERLSFIDTLPADMAASMYHDLMRGNRLELPWLSGGVVALGERLGVPTPLNRTMADVLAPYELGHPGVSRRELDGLGSRQ